VLLATGEIKHRACINYTMYFVVKDFFTPPEQEVLLLGIVTFVLCELSIKRHFHSIYSETVHWNFTILSVVMLLLTVPVNA